jgi:hypothetical protein
MERRKYNYTGICEQRAASIASAGLIEMMLMI